MAGPSDTIALDRHTYEDPFLDMASTKLPKSFKKLLELCQIFAMTHPQISPIIQRLAEYPITSLVFKGDDESERQHKELFNKHLRILEKLVEFGLDYFAYGNCFVSISFPFVRMYRCKTCKTDFQAREVTYRYTGGRFSGRCRSCAADVDFQPIDQYVKNKADINIFRFEPQLITPKYNRVTGKYFYYYAIPPDLKRSIQTGDRDIIDSTPVEYLECVRLRRSMKLKRVFHFKRPTLSGRDMQWGFPLILPALKDAYLNQIYKKADEAIALEHSVPLRVIYPEPRTRDPMQMLALGNFRQFMSRNIRYWRRDKNAIITAPIPIGTTNIGGDASAYSTINARVKVVDEIMGAMMVTRGFVLGGENWSSQSISQRVMENSFMNYLRRMDTCLQWIRDEVAAYLDMPPCGVTMKPFKKVDDVQMLQLIIQLAQQKRVSWDEALSRMDLDAAEELKIIEKETVKYTELMMQELIAQNDANARAIISQQVAQFEAQGTMEVLQGQQERSSGVRAEIEGKATKEEFIGQQQEGQAQAQAQDPATNALSARAEKDRSEAGKNNALAQRAAGGQTQQENGQSQQPQQSDGNRQVMMDVNMSKQIALWAGELLSMNPADQRKTLKRMQEQNPEIARAVADVADEMQRTGQKPDQGQQAMTRSSDPRAMLDSLLEQAKGAEDLAKKIELIDPRQQADLLQALQQRNAPLFIQVMRLITESRKNMLGGSGGSGGNVVDMRALPEQKPPTRQDKPV